MRHDAQERRTMSYVTESWEMAAQTVIKKFEKRGISACYCATKEEAKETILNMIPKGSKVANGGTESMVEAGIMEAVKGPDYHYIDRNAGKTPQEAREIYAQIVLSDYYLMSTNASCQYLLPDTDHQRLPDTGTDHSCFSGRASGLLTRLLLLRTAVR